MAGRVGFARCRTARPSSPTRSRAVLGHDRRELAAWHRELLGHSGFDCPFALTDEEDQRALTTTAPTTTSSGAAITGLSDVDAQGDELTILSNGHVDSAEPALEYGQD
jgi:hypothetical protein